MNNKGFSLVTVLVLSLIIFLIGGTGLYIAATNFRASRADINYNLADKTSNAGLLTAFDEINKTGSGGNDRTITGTIGNASYKTKIVYGGKNNWFLSSEGTYHNSKIIKTALFQGYSGIGLYTIRGRVTASIQGARLSGCDAAPTPDCYVPAFIASGTISTGSTTPKSCTATGATNGTSAGLYGSPGTLNLDQGDLSRIFFKVKCFNKFNNAFCTTSMLDYLEYDYGRNPIDTNQDFSFQQNCGSANGYGIPVVNGASLSLPAVPSVASSCVYPGTTPPTSGLSLNLTTNLTTCAEIVLNSAITTITITGDGTRSGQPVRIYTNGTINQPTFSNASNFIFYTNRPFTVGNSSNFTIHSTNTGTFNTQQQQFYPLHHRDHYLERHSRYDNKSVQNRIYKHHYFRSGSCFDKWYCNNRSCDYY